MSSSPKKGSENEIDSTFFSQLSHTQKQTKRLNNQLTQDIDQLQIIKAQFSELQKQSKHENDEFSHRSTIEIKHYEQKIKNSLIIQKAEFKRLANQINDLVAYHKQINSHLSHLAHKFQQFQKNVGI